MAQPAVNNYPGYENMGNAQLRQQMQEVQDQMRQVNNNQNPQTDPQMDQINALLGKILDVQHPEAMRDRLEKEARMNKGRVLSIAARRENVLDWPLGAGDREAQVGFYGLPAITDSGNTHNPAIPAVVHETQVLTNGATVKLRLSSDILVAGDPIPKGSFVFGNCTLTGERLNISVTSIREGDKIYPVSMGAYDMDGQEGIRIPGAISRDAAKDGIDQGVQSMNIMSLDPSVGGQAASAVMQAAKGLLGKKIKLVKATVRAGYQLLLMDKTLQQLAH